MDLLIYACPRICFDQVLTEIFVASTALIFCCGRSCSAVRDIAQTIRCPIANDIEAPDIGDTGEEEGDETERGCYTAEFRNKDLHERRAREGERDECGITKPDRPKPPHKIETPRRRLQEALWGSVAALHVTSHVAVLNFAGLDDAATLGVEAV
jgi:hypothetical protein